MANLIANTQFGVMQEAFYNFSSTDNSSNYYVHMKTNIAASSNNMFYIEAEGYNYGAGYPILCAWSGYPYSGNGMLINVGLRTHYSGMQAYTAYQSTNGYVVLVGYAGSHYYTGFVLNSIMANPNGYNFKVSISAAVQTSTSVNYY